MRTMKRREQRRAKGVKPRAVYLETSLSRTKPWEAEGISRRTWERRRDTLATANGDRLASTKNRPVASVSHSTLLPVVLGDRPATSNHDKKGDFRGSKIATKLPWATPTVTEVTDPVEASLIRQAIRQADPFLVLPSVRAGSSGKHRARDGTRRGLEKDWGEAIFEGSRRAGPLFAAELEAIEKKLR
jgi:hypothetical protein